MKTGVSVVAVSSLSLGIAPFMFPELTRFALGIVSTYWWALPLSIATASFAGLGTTVILGSFRKIPLLAASSTGFYLAVGPSIVGLNLVPVVSNVSPAPWWAYPILVALTFFCAWAYYVASSHAEGSEPMRSSEPAFIS